MDRATWRRYQEMMIRARFAAAFLFLLALAAQARVPQWTLVDLGTLGGDFSIASAVGNDGAVAGYSIAPNPGAAPGQPTGLSHAFLWRNGTMVDLGEYPNSEGVTVVDMNESGTIVASGLTTGALVWRDGQWTQLADNAYPHAINNAGVIVGQHAFGVHTEAFVYTGSALLGLGTFGGSDSVAIGVNDRGWIVGAAKNARGAYRGFLLIKRMLK